MQFAGFQRVSNSIRNKSENSHFSVANAKLSKQFYRIITGATVMWNKCLNTNERKHTNTPYQYVDLSVNLHEKW